MDKLNFNDLEWHDAVIKNIIVDRNNPGNKDTIEISIVWPSGKKNKIVFNNVYYANLSLGFGVVADEVVSEAQVSYDNDDHLAEIKSMWSKHYTAIENIKAYKISTSSTGSIIKVIAFSFDIMG